MVKKAQYKIMQMAFMIVAVFVFFVMVGIFFFNFQIQGIASTAQVLTEEKTLALISSIANSPELHCSSSSSLCVDFDKTKILSDEKYHLLFEDFWSVSSVELLIISPGFEEVIPCQSTLSNCNFYQIYNTNKTNIVRYSSYVTLCEKKQSNIDHCKLAQLIVGL